MCIVDPLRLRFAGAPVRPALPNIKSSNASGASSVEPATDPETESAIGPPPIAKSVTPPSTLPLSRPFVAIVCSHESRVVDGSALPENGAMSARVTGPNPDDPDTASALNEKSEFPGSPRFAGFHAIAS